MTAASVLPPKPMPCAIPAASAMTFLTAPPTSTPGRSSLVYTRKYGAMTACLDPFHPNRVRTRCDTGRRKTQRAFTGKVRSGHDYNAVRIAIEMFGDHLAAKPQGGDVDTLDQTDQRRVRFDGRTPCIKLLPDPDRRDSKHNDVRIRECLARVRCRAQRFGSNYAR
jgi:hypothetical protein